MLYDKPQFNSNAYLYSCSRAFNDLQAIADDKSLSEYQRLLARQTCDLIKALTNSLKEFP